MSNFNNDDFEKLNDKNIPDVILVKKAFPNRRKKQRARVWKLKRLTNKDEAEAKSKKDAAKSEYEKKHFFLSFSSFVLILFVSAATTMRCSCASSRRTRSCELPSIFSRVSQITKYVCNSLT